MKKWSRLSSIFLVASLAGLSFTSRLFAGPQASPLHPIETTITQLVDSAAKFDGKLVRLPGSFHSDGIERSVLLEPNCGSDTPPPVTRQCSRGIVPVDSDKANQDPGKTELDRALAESGRAGTMGKHVTAEFTGKFRCIRSCASQKHFSLKIERVEHLKVQIEDLKPHRPEAGANGAPTGPTLQ